MYGSSEGSVSYVIFSTNKSHLNPYTCTGFPVKKGLKSRHEHMAPSSDTIEANITHAILKAPGVMTSNFPNWDSVKSAHFHLVSLNYNTWAGPRCWQMKEEVTKLLPSNSVKQTCAFATCVPCWQERGSWCGSVKKFQLYSIINISRLSATILSEWIIFRTCGQTWYMRRSRKFFQRESIFDYNFFLVDERRGSKYQLKRAVIVPPTKRHFTGGPMVAKQNSFHIR